MSNVFDRSNRKANRLGGKVRGAVIGAGLAMSLVGCGDEAGSSDVRPANYVLGSVVIDADGNRTTYVQTLESLDAGPFDNRGAIELPGNGVLLAGAGSFFVGLAEEPTWVRYSASAGGKIAETGRLSFLNLGPAAIDYGNVIVDSETAVSVFSKPALAVVWNPSTLKIIGEIDLSSLVRDGYELEVWTTVAHGGLVYVPGRWSDWEGGRIYPEVSTTLLDPKALAVVGTARDARCASGGRVVFDSAGYGYVMGDGRNYSIQMFANANGVTPPSNCLLRIAPGATEFDPQYFYTVASITGGLESIGELESNGQDTGIAFSKMFYRDRLSAGTEPVDFGFWEQPAHKLWRIELGEVPTAREVAGAPFATIGFSGSAVDGLLFSGESPDGARSDVYEVNPDANTARLRFQMAGYFDGLYPLRK